jgi:hypothetical protein
LKKTFILYGVFEFSLLRNAKKNRFCPTKQTKSPK